MKPYLRVANVFEDRIDSSDVMAMHFSDLEFHQYELKPGDILLNEGQSPHLLGRPAMYRGDPPAVAFTNSLLRFQAKEGILPSWALLVFRRHMHTRRFMAESQITTNIAHLSAGRFKMVEFPIPPLEEQRQIVASMEAQLTTAASQRSSAERTSARAAHLRSSILAAAFSGRLVSQDPDDEPASILLQRIAAERASSNGHKVTRARKPGATPTKAQHE
jgi:type I restriction enzyme S subunit